MLTRSRGCAALRAQHLDLERDTFLLHVLLGSEGFLRLLLPMVRGRDRAKMACVSKGWSRGVRALSALIPFVHGWGPCWGPSRWGSRSESWGYTTPPPSAGPAGKGYVWWKDLYTDGWGPKKTIPVLERQDVQLSSYPTRRYYQYPDVLYTRYYPNTRSHADMSPSGYEEELVCGCRSVVA